MKFIRKNKNLVLIVLILVAAVVAFFILKDTIMFDEGTAYYGNRLDGIEKVKVKDSQKKEVQDALKDQTKKVNIRVAGKIIYFTIETNPDISLEDAKKMGTSALEKFEEDQKSFFDFQFLISNSENKDQYPIIGYKQRTRKDITWTKDREKTEE